MKVADCKLTKCEKHGGTGLLIPFTVHNVSTIEWPLEVLKRDFLLIMEKKLGPADNPWPLEVVSSYYSDVPIGTWRFPDKVAGDSDYKYLENDDGRGY